MSFTERIRIPRRGSGSIAAALLFTGCLTAFGGSREHASSPPVKIPLEQLGFPGYPVALMHVGAAMETLHLLDATHVLFTFSDRSLVRREPGDPGTHHDRMVTAEVVEVPSGKILARTQWHLHDYGPYLWKVDHGAFVLRIGDALSVFAPLRGLSSGTAFARTVLPHAPGHPVGISVSPDGQIVTVQTQRPSEDDSEQAYGDEQPRQKHVVVEFYRVLETQGADRPLELRPAGVIGAPGVLELPLDGDGYLLAEDATHYRWAVSFTEFHGRQQPIAAIDSSCTPTLHLVSRGEFVALTCTGSDEEHRLSVFGFDGHENWREPEGDMLQKPVFVTAPDAGRFAVSRLSASSDNPANSVLGADDGLLNQSVRVYRTGSGDLLLDVKCQPAARSPQNFDLSPDGRVLAVLGSDAMLFYKLPDLTAQEKKNLSELQAMTPPVATGAVDLSRITSPAAPENASSRPGSSPDVGPAPQPGNRRLLTVSAGSISSADAPSAPALPVEAASGQSGPQGTTAARANAAPVQASLSGDPTPERRKPPTLLEPGEQPEFKAPPSGPQ